MYQLSMMSPLLCLLALALYPTLALEGPRYYDYLVVGAGPAGLQMGYFLKAAGRDYMLLERANTSGSFFSTYPRHDRLISLNKRHTGQRNKEFNLRHDWNSLLSDDESLLMKHYSQEMFPSRQSYHKYLQDFEEKLGIRVQYNTVVSNISQLDKPEGDYRVSLTDQHGTLYMCKTLIVATGLWKPADVPVLGKELLTMYEDISTNPQDFEGKSVLILGRGNSAFEVADSIYGSTNLIHMVGRSRVRLSWETHYVGDLRGVNNALLDTYQLKSLDGVLEADVQEIKLVLNEEGRIELRFRVDEDLDALYDNFALRGSYDVVISCLGWTFDETIFLNSGVSRGKNRRHKYPLIYHDYRSADFENIYYTGTITHSIDFRKSAGGFIHGFRYTTRALHQILEYKNHAVPWPHHTLQIGQLLTKVIKRLNEASGIYQMFSILCDVILIKDQGRTFEYYEEYPVNLVQRFHQYTGVSSPVENVLVVVFEYGKDFSGPGKDIFNTNRATGDPSEAHTSNFLHPVFYYYKKLPTIRDMINRDKKDILPTPDRIHHIVEDFLTEFTAPNSHLLPLRRLLETIVDEDLREYFAEDCVRLSLLYSSVPYSCQRYLSGEGLDADTQLWQAADTLLL